MTQALELGQQSINLFRSAMRKKFSHSFLISGNTNKFHINLDNTIHLDPTIDYEVALIRFDSYNSNYNVDSTNNNFKYFNGKVHETIILTPGAYEIVDINDEIHRLMKLQGGVITKVQEEIPVDTFCINLTASKTTLKAIFTLTNEYTVDFTIDKSLRTVLGYAPKVLKNEFNAADTIVMIKNFTSILINTDVCTGSYINNKTSQTLYSFSSNPVAVGYNISISPSPPLYLPLNSTKLSFNDFHVSITDENSKLVSFNGENLSMVLHIKSV